MLAASQPFHSSGRYRAPSPPTCSYLGWGLHWDVEMGRKTCPSPTLRWKNQRGSIPQKWGGGLAEVGRQAHQETGVRQNGETPRGDSEMGEGVQSPWRESREAQGGRTQRPGERGTAGETLGLRGEGR